MILRRLGLTLKKSHIESLAKDFDVDGSGFIGFEEFCVMAARLRGERQKRKIGPDTCSCEELWKDESFSIPELQRSGFGLAEFRKVGIPVGQIFRWPRLGARVSPCWVLARGAPQRWRRAHGATELRLQPRGLAQRGLLGRRPESGQPRAAVLPQHGRPFGAAPAVPPRSPGRPAPPLPLADPAAADDAHDPGAHRLAGRPTPPGWRLKAPGRRGTEGRCCWWP